MIVLIVLIYFIGLAGVKAELGKKQARALEVLSRMQTHLERTPGILDRMVALGCGDDAGAAVASFESSMNSLPEKASFRDLENAWAEFERTWTEVSAGCAGRMNDASFIELKTELEGIRNRYDVEKGNFSRAAEEYNTALSQFPATIYYTGFDPL
jgi:hypothetical protein